MAHQIIYFGSSFNPITQAHVELMKYLHDYYNKNGDTVEILAAPVYVHAFGGKSGADTYNTRCKMAELAIQDLVKQGYNIKVSRVDGEVSKAKTKDNEPPKSVYTWEVLQHLRTIRPDAQITLALGADTYRDLISGSWGNADQFIEKNCDRFMVFGRDGKDLQTPASAGNEKAFANWAYAVAEEKANATTDASKAEKILTDAKNKISLISPALSKKSEHYVTIIPNAIQDEHIKTISSTKIRESLEEAQRGTHPAVFAYMLENNLYDMQAKAQAYFEKITERLQNIEAHPCFKRITSGLEINSAQRLSQGISDLKSWNNPNSVSVNAQGVNNFLNYLEDRLEKIQNSPTKGYLNQWPQPVAVANYPAAQPVYYVAKPF